MALAAGVVVDVRNGGSDTLNGGFFNTSATMNSNLAATSATGNSPVVTSATYNFVAGDVGAWVFIKSGTNWTPGWYQIASVATNAATLKAAVGEAILFSQSVPYSFNTVAGCATTASPTSGSWSVDYSQQTTVQFSLTGLTTAAANAIVLTASASVNMIGNGVVITGGTNFTTGYYQINSVSAGVSFTVDRTCTTAAGAAGTAGIGGGLASPGMAAGIGIVAHNIIFVKYNATAYSASTASTNVSGGCVDGVNGTQFQGWDSSRFVGSMDANRPTYKVAASTATLFGVTGDVYVIQSFILDGDNQTSSIAVKQSGTLIYVKAVNFAPPTTDSVIDGATAPSCLGVEGTACTVVNGKYVLNATMAMGCYVHDNTCTQAGSIGGGFGPGNGSSCIASNNVGGDGFGAGVWTFCDSVGNGVGGFNTQNAVSVVSDSISAFNGGAGFRSNTGRMNLVKCADLTNTIGRWSTSSGLISDSLPITLTGDPFTNKAGGDYSLNNTAGAGALLRAAGWPGQFPLPTGTTVSYADIGAVQSQAIAGTSGGFVFGS